MIKSLYIDNFKSFVNFEIEMQKVNLLIGKNNVGKTNLCQALRFLSLSARPISLYKTVKDCIGSTVDFFNKDYKAEEKTTRFIIECTLPYEHDNGPVDVDFKYTLEISDTSKKDDDYLELIVDREILESSADELGGRIELIKNIKGCVEIYREQWHFDEQKEVQTTETKIPPYKTMLSSVYDTDLHSLCNLFKDYLSRLRYYDFEVSKLRSSEAKKYEDLFADGTNLFEVIRDLKEKDERRYRQWIELINIIEPRIRFINFSKPDEELVSFHIEDENGRKYGKTVLSNGTLRFMALAYILVRNETSLIIIEEPENGLYVGLLEKLLEGFEEHKGQYLLTTHNPYLIDYFGNNIEGIIRLKYVGSKSVLAKVDEEKIRGLLDEMSLGELHFRELFE